MRQNKIENQVRMSLLNYLLIVSIMFILCFSVVLINAEISNESLITKEILAEEELEKELEKYDETIDEETILIEITEIYNETKLFENNSKNIYEEEQLKKNETNELFPENSESNISFKTILIVNVSDKNTSNTPESIKNEENSGADPAIKEINSNDDQSNENETLINIDTISDPPKLIETGRKTKLICYKNSEKVFEGEISKKIDCNQINKKDIIETDNKKQVIIESINHINDPLTVYTNIPEISENQKKAIKIYWKNENKIITNINFHDEDNNGLYDHISWIVPHLSKQVFEIIIDFNIDNSSEAIEFSLISPINGETVINPVEFIADINYINFTDLNCSLIINGDESYVIKINELHVNKELEDGDYIWFLSCKDSNGVTINESAIQSFKVNESFSVSSPQKVYLKDSTEKIKVQISSRNNANAKVVLTNPSGFSTIIESSTPTPKELVVSRSLITETGLYNLNVTFLSLSKPFSIIKNFSIASLDLDFDEATIETNQEIDVFINITSPTEKILSVTLYLGDGNQHNRNPFSNNFYENIKASYDEEGDYKLNLTAVIDGRIFSITKNGIDVESSRDRKDPEIEMIYPGRDVTIDDTKITFQYKAEDDIKLENCTFELYNNSGSFGVLEYTTTQTNIENNKLIEVPMHQFEDGHFSWIVECYDNSTNYNYRSRDFSVLLNNNSNINSNLVFNSNQSYESKDEIEKAIFDLESFLTKKESFNLEDLNVLDNLKISEDLKYYQKRLSQIKLDLSNNLRFITDDSLRETRKEELLEEFLEINQNIPSDLRIIKKKEFVKNSITDDFEEILEKYFEIKKINKRNPKGFINQNLKIQKDLNVLTKVKNIEIEYFEDIKRLTLVTKEIEIKNDGAKTILEIIPEDISGEIIFITENDAIKENEIYEISTKDLIDGNLVYYIESHIDPDKLEKTETILYKENFEDLESGITGFFVYFEDLIDLGGSTYILILIVAIAIISYVAYFYNKQSKIKKWRKKKNAKRVFELKKQIKECLDDEEIVFEKEKYNEIRSIFPSLPEKCKKYLFKDLKKIKNLIAKKEINDLVNEYLEAKKQKRVNDAKLMYKKIKNRYSHLPKKQKEKVYNKIFKPRSKYEEL